tara:strand:- start:379 stop:552 length:174 start_codon:yes stop_codon:yes gene_type:complete
MPNVDGKKFPYTAAGKAAAKRAMGMKKGGLAIKNKRGPSKSNCGLYGRGKVKTSGNA